MTDYPLGDPVQLGQLLDQLYHEGYGIRLHIVNGELPDQRHAATKQRRFGASLHKTGHIPGIADSDTSLVEAIQRAHGLCTPIATSEGHTRAPQARTPAPQSPPSLEDLGL